MRGSLILCRRGGRKGSFESRFSGAAHRSLYFHHYLGNRLISFLFNLLYDQLLQDVEVGYKMMTREVKEALSLTSNGSEDG